MIGNTDSSPARYRDQIVLWDTLPKQNIYDEFARSMDIDHGMFLIMPNANSCEYFSFATKKGNNRIINTYLTKLDVLKNFITYFKEKASDIIKLVNKNKIYLPFHQDKLPFVEEEKHIQFKEIIVDHNKKIILSKRQIECAKFLLKGYTSKKIAFTTNLSES